MLKILIQSDYGNDRNVCEYPGNFTELLQDWENSEGWEVTEKSKVRPLTQEEEQGLSGNCDVSGETDGSIPLGRLYAGHRNGAQLKLCQTGERYKVNNFDCELICGDDPDAGPVLRFSHDTFERGCNLLRRWGYERNGGYQCKGCRVGLHDPHRDGCRETLKRMVDLVE